MNGIDKLIDQLKLGEYIKESEVKLICNKAKEILIQEPNVLSVEAPATVFLVIRCAVIYMGNAMIFWKYF